MDKMEYSKKTKEAFLAMEGKVPSALYRNLWVMHVALFSRGIAHTYPTTGKTFSFYCRLQMDLAADYSRLGELEKARAYRLAVIRTAARLLKKKEGK